MSHFHADHVAGLRSVFKRRVKERQPDGTIEIRLEERYRLGRYTADQNDRSVVMLQYGSFRYFLGGDIGVDRPTTS